MREQPATGLPWRLIENHRAFLAAHRGDVQPSGSGFRCVSEKPEFTMTFALDPNGARMAAERHEVLYAPDWVYRDLEPHLTRSHIRTHRLTYMARRSAPQVPGEAPPRLSIRCGRTQALVADFSTVQTAGFCETPASVAALGRWMRDANFRNLPAATQTFVVGYLEDLPVSCALVLDAAEVAGVYAVATLPGFRRQGFSSSIMATLGEAAIARGFVTCGLQVKTGSVAERFYAHIGYHALFHMHVLAPREDQAPALER